jgi:hypothetical protein
LLLPNWKRGSAKRKRCGHATCTCWRCLSQFTKSTLQNAIGSNPKLWLRSERRSFSSFGNVQYSKELNRLLAKAKSSHWRSSKT